jgi:hypothetical protein
MNERGRIRDLGCSREIGALVGHNSLVVIVQLLLLLLCMGGCLQRQVAFCVRRVDTWTVLAIVVDSIRKHGNIKDPLDIDSLVSRTSKDPNFVHVERKKRQLDTKPALSLLLYRSKMTQGDHIPRAAAESVQLCTLNRVVVQSVRPFAAIRKASESGASNVILMFLSMIPQHTSIVVFNITPFSPVIASADTNMSHSGNNNNRNNFQFSMGVSQRNALCACDNFNLDHQAVVGEVLTCRACRHTPTPRQVFDARSTAANNERDQAIDERNVALAKLEEARSTVSLRDATIRRVLAERDMHYRYVNRAHDQATAAINERDQAIGERNVALAKLEEARSTISVCDATVSLRDATIRRVLAERDMYYGYANRAHDQATAAINERDQAIDERNVALAKLEEARSTIRRVLAERDMYYGYANRAHDQATAAINERDLAIGQREAVVSQLGDANAQIKQLMQQLAKYGWT